MALKVPRVPLSIPLPPSPCGRPFSPVCTALLSQSARPLGSYAVLFRWVSLISVQIHGPPSAWSMGATHLLGGTVLVTDEVCGHLCVGFVWM